MLVRISKIHCCVIQRGFSAYFQWQAIGWHKWQLQHTAILYPPYSIPKPLLLISIAYVYKCHMLVSTSVFKTSNYLILNLSFLVTFSSSITPPLEPLLLILILYLEDAGEEILILPPKRMILKDTVLKSLVRLFKMQITESYFIGLRWF